MPRGRTYISRSGVYTGTSVSLTTWCRAWSFHPGLVESETLLSTAQKTNGTCLRYTPCSHNTLLTREAGATCSVKSQAGQQSISGNLSASDAGLGKSANDNFG